MQALEGSRIQFRLRSNRPLSRGVIELTGGDLPARRVPMTPSAANEVTGSLMASDSGRLRFSLVDAAGLPSLGDWEGPLTVTHDLPPQVRISDPEHDSFVAADFKVQGQIEASDDYGLRSLRIHRGLNADSLPPESSPTRPILSCATVTR